MKKNNIIVTSIYWTTLTTAILSILKLFVTSILSRQMNALEFGVVSSLHIITDFAVVFYQMGFASAIIQRKDINKDDINTAYFITLIMGVFCCIIIFLSSSFIANFMELTQLDYMLKAYSIVFLFSGFSSIRIALEEKYLNFKKLMKIDILSYIVSNVIISLYLATKGYGAWSIIIGEVIYSFIRMCFIIVISDVNVKFKYNNNSYKKLKKSSSSFAIARLLGYLGANIDYLIIGKILGTNVLGLYNRTFQVMSVPTNTIGTVVEKVYFPGVSKIQNDINGMKDLYLNTLFSLSGILLPICTTVIILAPEIVSFLLGDNWNEVVVPLQLMSLCIYAKTIGKLNSAYLKSYKKVHYRIISQATTVLTVALGAWIGCSWGVNGVALCVTMALIFNALILMCMTSKMVNFTFKELFNSLKLPIITTIIYTILLLLSVYIFRNIFLDRYFIVLLFSFCVFTIYIFIIYKVYIYILNKNSNIYLLQHQNGC